MLCRLCSKKGTLYRQHHNHLTRAACLPGVPAAVASLLGLDPSLVGSGRGEGKSVKEMEAGELVTELATRVAARVQVRSDPLT